MKKYLTAMLLLWVIAVHCQKKEMADNFSKGFYDKVIEFGKDILNTNPDDFDALLLIAMAENEKGNYRGQSFINPDDDVL